MCVRILRVCGGLRRERIGGVSERRLAFSKLQNSKSHFERISAGVLLEGLSPRSRTAGWEK